MRLCEVHVVGGIYTICCALSMWYYEEYKEPICEEVGSDETG